MKYDFGVNKKTVTKYNNNNNNNITIFSHNYPTEKMYFNPYTQTQRVSNFCPILIPLDSGYILILIHIPIFLLFQY